jgi:hypothetical protein
LAQSCIDLLNYIDCAGCTYYNCNAIAESYFNGISNCQGLCSDAHRIGDPWTTTTAVLALTALHAMHMLF